MNNSMFNIEKLNSIFKFFHQNKDDIKAQKKALKIFKSIPKKCSKEAKRGNKNVIIIEYLASLEKFVWYGFVDTKECVIHPEPLYVTYLTKLLNENNISWYVSEQQNKKEGDDDNCFVNGYIMYTYKQIIVNYS